MKGQKNKDIFTKAKALALLSFLGDFWKLLLFFIAIIGFLSLYRKLPIETVLILLVVFLIIMLLFRSYAIEQALKRIEKILGQKFPLPPSKEAVGSPGYIMSKCVSATVIKENPRDGDVEIWVSCKQKIMTTDGCPPNCPKYEEPPKPTGQGAFGGMVLGGIIGLVGGPAGVILGGLLGGLVGHGLESSVSIPSVEKTLTKWRNLDQKPILHVEE